MSDVMDEEQIKRWTARRKSALVLEIIQGKTTVTQASRQFDLTPAEIESWVEDGKRGMEPLRYPAPTDPPRMVRGMGRTAAERIPAALILPATNSTPVRCAEGRLLHALSKNACRTC